MLSLMEKILFLKTVSLFREVNGSKLKYLAENSTEITYQQNEIIFKENDVGDALYIIIDGEVKIFALKNNEERVFAILHNSDCFGEMAILDHEKRSAGAKCAGKTILLKVDKNTFYNFISENVDVAFEIFKVLSKRLRDMNVSIKK